ncbi:MAG: hypothetical protein EXR47_03340 [Dehalococcoidia bacterium]|nr:hypothetical protein [Dehalococcoidia bacterium]
MVQGPQERTPPQVRGRLRCHHWRQGRGQRPGLWETGASRLCKVWAQRHPHAACDSRRPNDRDAQLDHGYTSPVTLETAYDAGFVPPAPTVEVVVQAVGSSAAERVVALLDTGSALSAIPQGLVERFGLQQVDLVEVRGVGQVSSPSPVFIVQMALSSGETWVTRVIGWRNPFALLGRNVLNRWRVTLDGPAQRVRIDPT